MFDFNCNFIGYFGGRSLELSGNSGTSKKTKAIMTESQWARDTQRGIFRRDLRDRSKRCASLCRGDIVRFDEG